MVHDSFTETDTQNAVAAIVVSSSEKQQCDYVPQNCINLKNKNATVCPNILVNDSVSVFVYLLVTLFIFYIGNMLRPLIK